MVRTIVAVVLAAAAVVCGAEPTQKTCTLAGRIVSASSGEGIHRAVVTVRSQRTDRNMLSGPGGEFLFRGLEPGTYTLQAAAQGFAQRSYGERKGRPERVF